MSLRRGCLNVGQEEVLKVSLSLKENDPLCHEAKADALGTTLSSLWHLVQ